MLSVFSLLYSLLAYRRYKNMTIWFNTFVAVTSYACACIQLKGSKRSVLFVDRYHNISYDPSDIAKLHKTVKCCSGAIFFSFLLFFLGWIHSVDKTT
jgi:uncharacterized Fe-S cluster protein YjdI